MATGVRRVQRPPRIPVAPRGHRRAARQRRLGLLCRSGVRRPATTAEVIDACTDIILDEHAAGPVRPLPGALDLVAAAERHGPVAVATASPRRFVLTVLDTLRLTTRISAVICGEDVGGPNPRPTPTCAPPPGSGCHPRPVWPSRTPPPASARQQPPACASSPSPPRHAPARRHRPPPRSPGPHRRRSPAAAHPAAHLAARTPAGPHNDAGPLKGWPAPPRLMHLRGDIWAELSIPHPVASPPGRTCEDPDKVAGLSPTHAERTA
ncbi:hypothetical protein SAMN05428944_7703 [Streptomyces sp. 1222.5]|nr:hypothetical protein BX260_0380 [Streptomyces sp. 5112.2]SED44501.1 hypothetical protein SAMN05428944_7703 [Streptomyces sp. 1222.5]